MQINSIVILGTGNVGYHLANALLKNSLHVIQVYNRTIEKAKAIGELHQISYTDDISKLQKADLYIITTSDSAVEGLSSKIPFEDCLVVHTAGSLPVSVLKGNYQKGVIYPLQTFTKNKALDYSEIPFFIEAENKEIENALTALCLKISKNVYSVDFERRRNIQMCGVWVNNFTNHLYYIATEICKENEVPFDVLKPLIAETANKIIDILPYDAQTGPARRNDQVIIDKHLEILNESDDKFRRLIYELLTDSIRKTYG